MRVASVIQLPSIRQGKTSGWLPWLPLAGVFAWSIAYLPFPQNLAITFALPLVMTTWYNAQAGIIIWLVLSTVGNRFGIDLPGIPPLRPTHLILLTVLGVWFVRSYQEIPGALSRFLRTGKNRVLLVLLGWVTLSMVVGQLSGVTQKGTKYQFNAWFAIVRAILLALVVSNYVNRRLVNGIVWSMIILGTAWIATVLVLGILSGAGLFGWKSHFYQLRAGLGIIGVGPLIWAVLFLPEQKGWGKILFAISITLSILLHSLMALSGSRSDLLPLVPIGFFLLFAKPRLLLAVVLLALPVLAWSASSIESWLDEQIQYQYHSGYVSGKGNRIGLWLDAAEVIQRHPIWGTGTDFYRLHARVKVPVSQDGKPVLKWSTSPHNSWLQIAADHGIPAALLMALFYWYLFKDALFLYRSVQDRVYKRFSLLFLVTTCVFILLAGLGTSMWPVFTVSDGNEETLLASFLIRFWLPYGVFLGIEGWNTEQMGAGDQRR